MDSFASFDGVEIAYHAWGDAEASPPVVLHHGFSVDAPTNWAGPGIVQQLVDAGFFVVGIDARGHGASEKPYDPAAYGEENMARDVSALVDVLGAEQFDLVGYSMGGVVSLLVAASDERVRSLVVGGIGAATIESGGIDTTLLDRERVAAVMRADEPGTDPDALVNAFRMLADAVAADRHALAAVIEAARSGPIPTGRITARTLVINGDEDPLARRPEVLAQAIPDATLTLVAGDHMSAVTNPEFVGGILAFLQAGAD